MILVSFCRILNGLSNEINFFWRCSSPLMKLSRALVGIRPKIKHSTLTGTDNEGEYKDVDIASQFNALKMI